MLLTAYVDACTTKFYFHEFFLAVPIVASRETSEKILMEWLFLREMVVLQETYHRLGFKQQLMCKDTAAKYEVD